ncbi:MAG TPA: tripartite tricarboxylate transporter TctB family protein [Ramlibacter sp.]|nr:tripartite tricarboxylate transporter TctB family protein [Ramlibacter sp.]
MIRIPDIAGASALVVLGAYGLVSGFRFGLGEATAPGPGFVPAIAGIALLVLAAAVGVKEVVAPAPEPATAPDEAPLAPDAIRRIVGYIAGIFGFAFLMQPMGALPTIGLFFLWILRGVERKSWRLTLAMTAGATLGAWLLFAKALKVSLPVIGA